MELHKKAAAFSGLAATIGLGILLQGCTPKAADTGAAASTPAVPAASTTAAAPAAANAPATASEGTPAIQKTIQQDQAEGKK